MVKLIVHNRVNLSLIFYNDVVIIQIMANNTYIKIMLTTKLNFNKTLVKNEIQSKLSPFYYTAVIKSFMSNTQTTIETPLKKRFVKVLFRKHLLDQFLHSQQLKHTIQK